MVEDQLRVVESLRSRPWRTVAVVGMVAVCFASAALVRQHYLRQSAIQAWGARSAVVARLTTTRAAAWLAGRQGDARLLATAASRNPQLFGEVTPQHPRLSPARIAESMAQSLKTLSQLHPYKSVWLFDSSGSVVGTSSAQPPPRAVKDVAMASLAIDSGTIRGPFPDSANSSSIAFAQRVSATSTDPAAGHAIGAVVLVGDAAPLFTELGAWSGRSRTEASTLVVDTDDSVYEYTLFPDRLRGTLRGSWSRPAAPAFALAAFASNPDTLAAVVGPAAQLATRIEGFPWAVTRREATSTLWDPVDNKLITEASTAAATLFMIAIVWIARRQTSRERKMLQVAESEVRYRLLADNATDVIARHSPEGVVVYLSPAVHAILGYRPRQLEGRRLSELSHEDDPTTMDQVLDQLRVTSGASRAEHRLRHAAGHYVWMETTGRAVRDPVWGNVTELVTVSRDIASRKQAEEALRASEEEYRVLFEANPLPMWAFDADSCRFIAVNDAAVTHYGYTREEFLTKTIFDIRPPEDVPDVLEKIAQVRTGLRAIPHSRHVKKDGTVIDVDMTVHPVTLAGRITWLVLVKDVTETKRTAIALRESNDFVRALFDSSPVAIIATSMDLRVMQWNGAAERLFGWTAAEVIGKPYPLASREMAPEIERGRQRALRDGRFIDVPVQRLRKDGSLVDVSLSVGVIRNAEAQQPTGFVTLAADLSERAKLEAQLRHAQKMDAVGQLAGGIAHDFNNLLTVVTGYAGILLAELPRDDAIRPDIEEIMGAADRAAVLTRQLLAFSRQQMLQPRVLDLNDVVRGMEQMLRRVLPEDIKLVTSLADNLGSVNADPGQIEQVLMNLIVNARDAMPDGGELTIETMDTSLDAADPTAREGIAPGDYVMLAVSDTGCGMTRTVQARIFEPFFTTKERGKGTGLGLSTAHGIVTQSGGYLSVYSEPGLGTSFKVCLPRITSPVAEPRADVPSASVAHGAELVLLVEDDVSVRVAAKRILERAGYRVLVAANGHEALAIHEGSKARIDLLITDMVMPEMSGRELVARIREREPDVAVLVMSGYTEQTSLSQKLVDSGSAFIQKPFTPESLTAKVRDALGATVPTRAS